MITINIANDFSKTPGTRYNKDGDFSGEEFREKFLLPLFQTDSNEEVKIMMDGVIGYPFSFLVEAFGGLARKIGSPEKILNRLRIECTDNPTIENKIKTLIKGEN